jgi:hypothetical protein
MVTKTIAITSDTATCSTRPAARWPREPRASCRVSAEPPTRARSPTTGPETINGHAG